MIQNAIKNVVEGQHLKRAEAQQAMLEIMTGEIPPTLIAAFLVALRMKGETVEEVTGFAEAMREKMTPVCPSVQPLVDTCGTGGDCLKTFNISTTAAFVTAGAGVAIAKHGNRAVSSACGSADVLEALGIRLDLTPQQISTCIDEVGIGFLFAPVLHPAMKYAAPVRKELGIRTVFNMLGPLANPASAQSQVLGVFSPALTESHARVLGNLGSKKALVVHGMDGMDEITTTGDTRISTLSNGEVITKTLNPEELGVKQVTLEDLRSDDGAQANAAILVDVLQGIPGPKRDIVLVNAAAALIAAGKANDFKEGIQIAAESIDSGKAMKKLKALQEYTGKA